METIIKILLVVTIFAVGYTMGQGHYPLDFDNNGKLETSDVTAALNKVMAKKE